MRVTPIRFQIFLDKFLTSSNTKRDAADRVRELTGRPFLTEFAGHNQCHNLRQ